MQAIVAKTVRTQAATAVVAGRPSRSAAVAAGKLASAALNSSNANANGHSSQSPEPGTARRSRSPSSSLSPVPATPPPAGEALVDPEPSTVPVKRSASPAGTGSEDAKPVKKKRTRKPKEPEVYVIPDVERKETTFNRTCRIDTIEKEDKGMPYLKELGRQNVLDLIKMIEWTAAHHIYFLRAHPDYQYSLEYAAEELKLAGETARRLGVRLTSHPAQFCNLCSPRNVVIENAYRDLEYHNEFFTRMGMGKDSVMIIHGGGVHGDKEAALQRFRKHYKELSDGVKGRLVLENDEFSYSVDDLLPVCEDLNIPLVFDYHHHSIFPTNQPIEELMPRILALWESKGIRPKFHLSEPRKGAVTPMERRAHADRCQSLPTPLPDDIDLMIEAKDKEQAVFHLYRIYDLAPTIHESLRPPAEEETLQTAGRKSNKAKSPKKGKKGEVVGTDEIKAGDPNEEVKVEAAVEEGVAPLPEGKDAEGQAYSPPVDPENVQALQEQEQQAKPKKRVAGRSQKAKEVEPVAGDEPKPKKQRRAPKKKAAAIPTEPMQTDDSAAPA
ncbi:hypothetical protein C6P46_002196 [Rhodotorula mucilaginosa]|uniref:UV-endonuclease UvdE n=1 Tax=Rhodotorula mucilaginosa TaxID=5537 RepID=A0A9P6VST0_RHOMI|nr:hypothetical protein C6P46_002196 [Rhodotorula mucilaginosa]